MEIVMDWNKKRIIASLLKACVAIFFAILHVACGDDSNNTSKPSNDDGREVATLVDMGRCTSEREGDTVYVAEKLTDYLCQNKSWVDLSENATNSSSDQADALSSAKEPTSSSSGNDASSSNEETAPEEFIRENISVTGVAQKGPFKFGSPLNLYELRKDLKQSGREYNDEISSNKGDFVIPNVSLFYPYAKLEVRGLYRNEVTGEWSADSMTLRALTDFSEERTEVNINLLTHLEYDRALYLVQNKGYGVYAAKKQAAQEIMTAFEFATAVTYSENFSIFQNAGVSANTRESNGTLLAISVLFMGNRSDTEIQNAIDKFREDLKTDGEWNDLRTKASMADWAYDFNYSTIRASVKSWNIMGIPDYETYLNIYWNNVYGLGGCSVNRKDIVAPNINKLSKNYNMFFICNSTKWVEATTYQKDTYEWTAGKSGELKKGNVTDTIYVYDGSKWNVAERETAIGLCQNSNAGVVSEYDGVYYICKNNAWRTATVLEYDTFGKSCLTDGSIVSGEIVVENKYVCDLGVFREISDIEMSLEKACVSYTENEEIRKQITNIWDSVYICKKGLWIAEYVLNEGMFLDKRDSNIYRIVTIGSQTWMAENLNYELANSYCYRDSVSNCAKYGRLYKWAAAVGKSEGECGYGKTCSLPSGNIQGVCPEGWHLPSKAEWKTLINTVGELSSGKILKSQNGWSSGGNGTDSLGFSVLPAGYRDDYGYFNYAGSGTNFWSSTENSNKYAYVMVLLYNNDYASFGSDNKSDGHSVRCLQD